MSQIEQPANTSPPERQKLGDDDHDLLTFDEVGERLRLEIDAAAHEVARLAQGGSELELTRAESRLRDLRAAAQRNAAQPINDANFERFFGYPGKARRGLPGPKPAVPNETSGH
ncbi:acyl-CoA synthetase [Mycobacterium sp. MBM]|nr:acyl-CoA synthetase [Mycobacterium sp. MBM]